MKHYFFLFLLLLPVYSQAQTHFRVMSYNVENLFDTEDDPETDDNEFLPSGSRHWTHGRYYHKLQQIARVICAAGEWSTPALVGLCEVENDSALIHLLNRTPLRQQHYSYCISRGIDPRGINVALLYQRDKLACLGQTSYRVRFTNGKSKPTRDILHVWGKVISGDTLDIFVCHFPSRYGGEKESEGYRVDAARTVRFLCDSLCHIRQTPQILIMGDFNDTPEDHSIRHVLGALPVQNPISDPFLFYNLFGCNKQFIFPGSHKYQGEWSRLDQIIVSGRLLNPENKMRLIPESVQIFAPDFIQTKDKTWRGFRPKRTYYGFQYEGGYSDHFPLTADFIIHSKN